MTALPPTTPVVNTDGETIGAIGWTAEYVLGVSMRLASVADAWRFQRAVDQQLQNSGVRRVLIDGRPAVISPPDVNESMWTWVKSNTLFDRLAILNQSTVLSVAAKMKALALGTKKVGVFTSLDEATTWLAR